MHLFIIEKDIIESQIQNIEHELENEKKLRASIEKNENLIPSSDEKRTIFFQTYQVKLEQLDALSGDQLMDAQQSATKTEIKTYKNETLLTVHAQISETLRINHALYQQILRAFGDRDFKTLEQLVTARSAVGISSTLRTSLKTLRKHLPYIANSFIYSYNNGRIEGINNKIKVLNRVAYGYRNFNNYRSRIMIHFKFKAVEPSQQKTNIQAA